MSPHGERCPARRICIRPDELSISLGRRCSPRACKISTQGVRRALVDLQRREVRSIGGELMFQQFQFAIEGSTPADQIPVTSADIGSSAEILGVLRIRSLNLLGQGRRLSTPGSRSTPLVRRDLCLGPSVLGVLVEVL